MNITVQTVYYLAVNKRDAILDSAEDVIRQEGAQSLTLERVAGRAKVSKGGLLYHFPSKEQLLSGLVARSIEYFDRDMERAKASLPEGSARNLEAFLLATFHGRWAQDASLPSDPLTMFVSLLGAFFTDPKLAQPVRDAYRRWQSAIESDGVDPALATIIRLAADGFWYSELFGFDEFTQDRRKKVVARLRKMCVEAAETARPVREPAKPQRRVR